MKRDISISFFFSFFDYILTQTCTLLLSVVVFATYQVDFCHIINVQTIEGGAETPDRRCSDDRMENID